MASDSLFLSHALHARATINLIEKIPCTMEKVRVLMATKTVERGETSTILAPPRRLWESSNHSTSEESTLTGLMPTGPQSVGERREYVHTHSL